MVSCLVKAGLTDPEWELLASTKDLKSACMQCPLSDCNLGLCKPKNMRVIAVSEMINILESDYFPPSRASRLLGRLDFLNQSLFCNVGQPDDASIRMTLN